MNANDRRDYKKLNKNHSFVLTAYMIVNEMVLDGVTAEAEMEDVMHSYLAPLRGNLRRYGFNLGKTDRIMWFTENVTLQFIWGMEVEMEHTDDPLEALRIANDHLNVVPDYYDRLGKVEDKAAKEWK